MMEIKLEGNNVLNETDCVVCGDEMRLEPVAAVAYLNGERLGDVCFGCIRGGPQHMQKKVAKNAEGLRFRAKQLMELADQLPEAIGGEIICPPWKEFQKKLSEIEGSSAA